MEKKLFVWVEMAFSRVEESSARAMMPFDVPAFGGCFNGKIMRE